MCSVNEEYTEALNLAIIEFQTKDKEEICNKSGAYLFDKFISIDYLNENYLISLNNSEIKIKGKDENVNIKDKIIILHYLNYAKGEKPTNKLITLREIREAAFYHSSFVDRVNKPLIKIFDKNINNLKKIMIDYFNAEEKDIGDLSFKIKLLPKVDIIIVWYMGDEEFSSSVNVLFDKNVVDYLPIEDIIVICERFVDKLNELING